MSNNQATAVVTAQTLRRSHFPQDFVFGTATSSYQIEGAATTKYGKGPNVWDVFLQRNPGAVADGSNGFTACDAYHRYKGDVKLMKKMGVDAYRFSISWPRILPGGSLSGGINQEGIDYYNNLIDELLANGIEPYVTLFHWDLPQALQDAYGGFSSPKIVDDFRNYAELCFWEFGDRVKNWITLNEPWSYVNFSFIMASIESQPTGSQSTGSQSTGSQPTGSQPTGSQSTGSQSTGSQPTGSQSTGQSSSSVDPKKEYLPHRLCPADSHTLSDAADAAKEPYVVAHNQLLSHAAAVESYRKKFQTIQNGKIGISLNITWLEPLDETSSSDKEAALRGMDFQFGWFMEPITTGNYPATMRNLVQRRLPTFTPDQSTLLKGSYNFVGINYYRAQYATPSTFNTGPLSYQTDSQVTRTSDRNGVPIGPMNGSQWINIYPQGIYKTMVHVKQTYNDPLIFITENGLDQNNDINRTLEEACNDPVRADYIRDHLFNLYQAIQEGVKIKAYFVWSLMDNFEWLRGYTDRMGIIHVDFQNGLTKYPKLSAIWFMNFMGKGESEVSTKRKLEGTKENNSNKKSRT